MVFNSRLRNNSSNTHKHREKFGVVVKEYEITQTESFEVDYILDDVFEVCRNKTFHTFENRCINDNKYTNITSIEHVISTITQGYLKFKSEFYGLNRKIKNSQKHGFKFDEIVKLTIKFDSSL